MNKIYKIKYNAELMKAQVRLEQQIEVVNKEIKEAQSNCHHINIILGNDGKHLYNKCLLCEKIIVDENKKYPTIDATEYKNEKYSNGSLSTERAKRLDDIRKLLIVLIEKNPEDTEQELFIKLEEKVKRK